jgi:hypothetical protein
MSIARDISRQTSRQLVTLTADQTSVTIDGGFASSTIDTYLNGAKLIQGSDYTLNGTSGIVLTQGGSAGDIIEFAIRNTSNTGVDQVNTSEILDGAVTYNKLSDSSTTADNVQQRVAKAWCYFNGSTRAINDSFNVSSITDTGLVTYGSYYVNFENSMSNTDYCVVTAATVTTDGNAGTVHVGARTTTNVVLGVINSYGAVAYRDAATINVAVFGD